MKIILNQDVVNLGEEGDVVIVKDGYARNYLSPTKLQYCLTRQTRPCLNPVSCHRKTQKQKAFWLDQPNWRDHYAGSFAGESGKLFGSVTQHGSG